MKSSKERDLIPARKNLLGELLVYWMCRRSLWRAFHAVRFRADAPLPAPPDELQIPILFYSNHSTWWDGYLAHIISREVYGLNGFLMMDVRQLAKYRFFTWAGVFSVDQENGRSALRSIDYLAEQLKQSNGRSFWIFPQGYITPQDTRPLNFHSGIARVVKRVGQCYVVPVAMRFEFFEEQYPEILIAAGTPRLVQPTHVANPKNFVADLETDLAQQLDELHEDVNNKRLGDFVTIIKGKGSTNTLLDTFTKFLPKKKVANG